MKKKQIMMMFACATACVAEALTLSVKDVKIAQRYPWNGLVDITYTVNCDDPTKDVWVYPVGYDADNDKTDKLQSITFRNEPIVKGFLLFIK